MTLILTSFGQTNENDQIALFFKKTRTKLRQKKLEDQFETF